VEEKIYQDADRNIVRNKFDIGENEILLLLVSRLTAEKNIEFLFRAAVKVLKNNKNTKFLVVGDGYLVSQLKSMAEDYNLQDRIIFEGIVDISKIKNYYAAGDIFIYASKSETQGMIVSEAMYMGLPVVAVSATGSKDLVENNVNGFLVREDENEFAAAVEKLINDRDLRQKFGANSARIAREKYTDSICANKMLDVYEVVIQNAKCKNQNVNVK